MSEQEIRIKALEFALNYANGYNRGGHGPIDRFTVERLTNSYLEFIKEGKW